MKFKWGFNLKFFVSFCVIVCAIWKVMFPIICNAEENKIISLQTTTGTYTQQVVPETATICEDAEDGTTAGWSIYANVPAGASIQNVYDAERESNVISFVSPNGTSNGYRLRNADGSLWKNTTQFVLQWSMKYSQNYTIYIDVQTSLGHRYLVYSYAESDALGDGEYVKFGIGIGSKDGKWHTYIRDLEADLKRGQPANSIIQVNGFLIRGSGMVDDIKLMKDCTLILDVGINQSVYHKNDRLRLDVEMQGDQFIDLYLAIFFPDGSFTTITDNLNFSKLYAVEPYKTEVLLSSEESLSVMDMAVTESMPLGEYIFYGIAVPTGSDVLKVENWLKYDFEGFVVE